jgi:hypothetical protein
MAGQSEPHSQDTVMTMKFSECNITVVSHTRPYIAENVGLCCYNHYNLQNKKYIHELVNYRTFNMRLFHRAVGAPCFQSKFQSMRLNKNIHYTLNQIFLCSKVFLYKGEVGKMLIKNIIKFIYMVGFLVKWVCLSAVYTTTKDIPNFSIQAPTNSVQHITCWCHWSTGDTQFWWLEME